MEMSNPHHRSQQRQRQQQQQQQLHAIKTPQLYGDSKSSRLLHGENNDVHIGIIGSGLAGLSTALAILRAAKNNPHPQPQNRRPPHHRHHQQHHDFSRRVIQITIYERRQNPSSTITPSTSHPPIQSSISSIDKVVQTRSIKEDGTITNNNDRRRENDDMLFHNFIDANTTTIQEEKGYGMTLTYDPVGPLAKLDILEEVAKRDCPSRCHYLFNENGDVRGYFGNAFLHSIDDDNNDNNNKKKKKEKDVDFPSSQEGKAMRKNVRSGWGQRGNMRIPRSELRSILLKKVLSEANYSNFKETTKMSTTTTTSADHNATTVSAAITTKSTTPSITSPSIGDDSKHVDAFKSSSDDYSSNVVVNVDIVWNKSLLSYVDHIMLEKLHKSCGKCSTSSRTGNSHGRDDENGQHYQKGLYRHDHVQHEQHEQQQQQQQQQQEPKLERSPLSTQKNRPVSLLFEDGTTARVDLLIGADGVNSVVAKQYLSTKFECHSINNTRGNADDDLDRVQSASFVSSKDDEEEFAKESVPQSLFSSFLSDVSGTHEDLTSALPRQIGIFIILGISNHYHPLIDERGFYTLDGSHRLFVMPYQGSRLDDEYDDEFVDYDDDLSTKVTEASCNNSANTSSIHPCGTNPRGRIRKRIRQTMWQLSFPVNDSSEAMQLSRLSPIEKRNEVLRRCRHWHTPVPDLIEETSLASIWGTSLRDRDPQVFIDHRSKLEIHGRLPSRVVLLGDAAHSMSPFKGQGANQALADGPLLAHWLSKARVDSAVRGFMSEMARRSGVKVRASREAAQELHSIHCWKWMARQDKTTADSTVDDVEATFHGIRAQHVSTLLRTLKERKVGADLKGWYLDDAIRNVIRELDHDCAETLLGNTISSPPKESLQVNDEISQLQSKALIFSSTGDLRMLRQLSRKNPQLIPLARYGEYEQSCLHLAAMHGHVDVCRWLLSEVNMDCFELNANAKSAVDLAVDAGYDSVACLLRRWASILLICDNEPCGSGKDNLSSPESILTMKATLDEVNHRGKGRSLITEEVKHRQDNGGYTSSPGEGIFDAYRHVEQQLRGIRTKKQLRLLLRKNRITSNHSPNHDHQGVTHVLGCHLDEDDVQYDSHGMKELATHHGAVILRKFIPRDVDQWSIAALALRPLNLYPSSGTVVSSCGIAADSTSPNPTSDTYKKDLLRKGIVKFNCNNISIPADSSIIVQTNFWPQMQIPPCPDDDDDHNHENRCSKKRKKIINSFPLHRLRYINLGIYNYNWSSRVYEKVPDAAALPNPLVSLAQHAHALARKQTSENGVDVRSNLSKEVEFDMAICNIYHIQRPSDRLGGHKDNVESDLSLPLVTVSLGAPGIFLLGGMSREDVPTAILLEAGDCMVMSGASRQYFHGVPTILLPDEDDDRTKNDHNAYYPDIPSETYCVFPETLSEGSDMILQHDAKTNANAYENNNEGNTVCRSELRPSLEELTFAKSFLSTVRMNVSIRRV